MLGAVEGPFKFTKWQRVVPYRYALEPLSVKGSVLPFGGRFNIGDINNIVFTPFPALYIAKDKLTALQESLCQKINPGKEQKALEFALLTPTSTTNVSISGTINTIINLDHAKRLQAFVDVIQNFQVSESLVRSAKIIKLPPPDLVRTVESLLDSLGFDEWRNWPTQLGVPHPSQIFGQIVMECGIEGIHYRSKFSGKRCLVIYYQNFTEENGSFVKLDDKAPQATSETRIDAEVWARIKGAI
ncbi:RES domain-containing protein [Candidatus Neomarinimicrobiota bacterium]